MIETVETRPMPIEVVTPMRPSEAIRLGCLIAPRQAFGRFQDGAAVCVLGAMNLGLGKWTQDCDHLQFAEVRETEHMSCPVLFCGGSAWPPHLNDGHRWSRERIADWLEKQGM